jgi:hypothetical protein
MSELKLSRLERVVRKHLGAGYELNRLCTPHTSVAAIPCGMSGCALSGPDSVWRGSVWKVGG